MCVGGGGGGGGLSKGVIEREEGVSESTESGKGGMGVAMS